MAKLTSRNVDAGVKKAVAQRAARHARSMEVEARSILREAVAYDRDHPEPNLAEVIRRRFAPLGGIDLDLPSLSLSTHRLRSIRDRSQHQCHFGADTRGTIFSS